MAAGVESGKRGRGSALELIPGRPLLPELRRVARGQLDQSLREIAERRLPDDEVVHEARKRCKKVRAILRLMRPALGEAFETENACFREASRLLAWVRDAQALAESCEVLAGRTRAEGLLRTNALLRDLCLERLEATRRDPALLEERLAAFAGVMQQARGRIPTWGAPARGLSTVEAGLAFTYGRGRRDLRRCREAPSEDHFHDWRKRVKYHWYHLRLLRGAWPEGLAGPIASAKELGQLLGDHHDLTVLRELVRAEAEGLDLEAGARASYLRFLRLRQREQEARALRLGTLFFVDRPRVVGRRLVAYWRAAGAAGAAR